MSAQQSRMVEAEMPRGVNVHHDFCSTESEQRLLNWIDVLNLQVDIFSKQEISLISKLNSWDKITSVLDVGCGNGRFLSELSSVWPDKQYSGIDSSAEFLGEAATLLPRVRFENSNFFTYHPRSQFDLVIMRFVVQHLENWDRVLAHSKDLLNSHGKLLVIEPELSDFLNTPPLPIFARLLDQYGKEAAARGRLRANLTELANQAEEQEWSVVSNHVLLTIHTGPFSGSKVLALYRGWAALCEQSGFVEGDYDAVRQELTSWGKQLQATSQIGLRVLELERS